MGRRSRHWPIRAQVAVDEREQLRLPRGSKLEKQAGATIPRGGAGLIVAYPHSVAAEVEPTVARGVTKVVGQAEGHHVKALKGALADTERRMAESTSRS